MQALVVEPGRAHSARAVEVPTPRRKPGTVLLRPLEVGVCGTDREISEGLFGIPPEGSERLVLGHEVLARVEEDMAGFARGDLVAATVRRSCGRCAACAQGSPDACETGLYFERGITRLNGFASELVAEDAGQLVRVPPSLGRLGVLAEPASICERALRHVRAIGGRQPWAPRRALVLGAGAIGMLDHLPAAPRGARGLDVVARAGEKPQGASSSPPPAPAMPQRQRPRSPLSPRRSAASTSSSKRPATRS